MLLPVNVQHPQHHLFKRSSSPHCVLSTFIENQLTIDIKVYYEGDLSEARGYLTVVPLHYKNRYDDYWTWELVLMAADGTKVDRNTFFVDQFMASDNDEKSAFYNAWNNLLPHILRAVVL